MAGSYFIAGTYLLLFARFQGINENVHSTFYMIAKILKLIIKRVNIHTVFCWVVGFSFFQKVQNS